MPDESLFAQDKSIVVPGQVIAKGLSYLPGNGTYRFNDTIVANRLGLLAIEGKVMKTVPLSGRYLPKRNDIIVGKVIDILMSGWRLEFNSPYTAVLPLKDATFSYIEKGDDLTKYFELDDYIVCKITNVTSQNLVDVSCKGPGLQKLRGGRIVSVNTHKVPRIIGKRGSMVGMIKLVTGCRITVGQNGIVWISGEPQFETVAVNALKLIEEKSHVQGLTEKVKSFLEGATGKVINIDELPEDNTSESSDGSFEDGRDEVNNSEQDRQARFNGRSQASRGRDSYGGFGRQRGGFRPNNFRGGFNDNRRDGFRGAGRPQFSRSSDSSPVQSNEPSSSERESHGGSNEGGGK
jgi:exosome complex component RRP4